MGIEYNKRSVGKTGGVAVQVNPITAAAGAATLTLGVNTVNYASSGVAADLLLPEVSTVGEKISVLVTNGTTSLEPNINTATTGSVFFGTTSNTVSVASTVNANSSIEFVAVSTSQWGVATISSTVHWTFTATTGSTGQ